MLRMLIGFLWKSMLCKGGDGNDINRNTRAKFWLYVCYSFFWLDRGHWPNVDEWDNPIVGGMSGELADGWSGNIFSIDADLDALSDEIDLENVASKEPCCFCGADEKKAPWIHLRKNAKFMKLLWTVKLWRARAGYKHRHLSNHGSTNASSQHH